MCYYCAVKIGVSQLSFILREITEDTRFGWYDLLRRARSAKPAKKFPQAWFFSGSYVGEHCANKLGSPGHAATLTFNANWPKTPN